MIARYSSIITVPLSRTVQQFICPKPQKLRPHGGIQN